MDSNILISKIDSHLDLVKQSTSWVDSSLEGEKSNRAHQKLVEIRRALKKKRFALDCNPAAAIYGESQVGKSYLVGSLLSEVGKSFGILDESAEAKKSIPEGIFYKFIEDINPIGGGNESTSLVSRFSVNFEPDNLDFPVKGVLLSVTDLILVLCDSFYKDVQVDNDKRLKINDIDSEVLSLKARYAGNQSTQSFITEDDIYDIKDYFSNNLRADVVVDSAFFKEVPLLIEKVPVDAWKDVFSLLWNKNASFTNLFSKLIEEYCKIDFSKEVFLPVDAVLNRCGTLLDVKRLNEIFNVSDDQRNLENYQRTTIVLLNDGRKIKLDKPYLCALTAELVFGQPKSLVDTKPFLKNIDLLDFPGARSRMEIQENLIESQPKNMSDFLLRGKVAYLFNKYSESEKINLLVLCAKHDQPAQRHMPIALDNWISNVIGKTPHDREAFTQISKVSPLFIVGTFFNVNLQFDPQQDKQGDSTNLNNRWNQRFERTLEELIETKNYSWFNEWTISEPMFRNIYLLRDFAKSETISKLYKGYMETGKEISVDESNEGYLGFREELRSSFINYPFVQKHFSDPDKSWDAAATINHDGTALIIENLSIAAENISKAREQKIIKELNTLKVDFLNEIRRYYHSNDKDNEIQNAKSTAANVQLQLDEAFAADGIRKFGSLMNDLMIKERNVLELFRKILSNINYTEVSNKDKYSTYRIQVPVLKSDDEKSYFDRLCAHYEKITPEQKEAFKKDLEDKGIDLRELISGAANLVKNTAQQLADFLLDYWLESLESSDKKTLNSILNNGTLQDIKEMYEKLFKKYGLENRIASSIRKYVESQSANFPYEIIADICSEELNNFVRSVGYDCLDSSDINDLRIANEKNHLGLKVDPEEIPEVESVEETFGRIDHWADIISTDPEQMKSLASYRNYLEWYNHLKIGFVTVCDIPNYDVAANNVLGAIIQAGNNIQYIF